MANTTAKRNNIWKWLVLAVSAVVSIYVSTPLFDKVEVNDKGEETVVQKGKIRLGLDLAGGTSFTLGVDRDRQVAELTGTKVEEELAKHPGAVVDTNALYEVSKKEVDELLARTDCDDTIVATIRRRVDSMGMNEPVIQPLKDHRILVQLPGASQEARDEAADTLKQIASLEFCLIHEKESDLIKKARDRKLVPPGYEQVGTGFVRKENTANPDDPTNYSVISKTPDFKVRVSSFGCAGVRGCKCVFEKTGEKNGKAVYSPRFVRKMESKWSVTGKDVVSAVPRRDEKTGAFCVSFRLNDEGGSRFSALTGANINKPLAIILDDELISAPNINSEIGTDGQITGKFSQEEAQKLANAINSGALPIPLKIEAESQVGPTVGREAIAKAKWAAGLGFALIAIFMFIYYWRSGLVADIALFLDIALLPTALVLCANVLNVIAHDPSMGGGGSMLLPVLTLPGIAGLVLSLGMAVDANVLVFERIREEFAAGKTAGDAIKNGYGRAFTAIFDSNLTTIITGIILFVVGTGPVRGFAIMLTAGVVISMFTAVVVTRLVFEKCVNPNRVKPFKMLHFFKNPKYDFMKVSKFTVGCSFTIIAIAMVIFAVRLVNNKASVLSVDLTGGTSVVYDFKGEKPAVADIRAAINDFDNAAVIQYQEGVGTTTLLIKTGETAETAKGQALADHDVGKHLTELLSAKFPANEFTINSRDEVGSMVGADLKRSGTYAVIFSLIAILVYVGFRFQFGFGLGALVALAHDALISLGLFSLCGRQVSLIVITAVLTIIGYSVNDTVVVFDRIREMLNRDRKLSFYDLCNAAVNSCLSRTVITSVTTLFAVLALFTFGDGSIFDFALIMLIGIVAGTFSSVFIATPIMYWWYKGKRPQTEDAPAK